MNSEQIFDKNVGLSENDVEVRLIGEPIGKGLFATKNFKEGEIIFEEDPLVSCQFLWNAAYGYLACDFCMRPLETAEENVRRLCQNGDITLPYESNNFSNPQIHCSYCHISYCSETCRKNAWNQYHETLCLRTSTPESNHPLVILQETWKHLHYPPETACIMLLARILATVRQSDDKEKTVSKFLQFCHRTTNENEEIAHKLLGKEFNHQLETLRTLMDKALGTSDVRHWLTSQGFQSLLALVGTNGQGIGTSSFSDWVKNCEKLEENLSVEEKEKLDKFIDQLYEKLEETAGSFLNNEGSGLYILQSSCNHSCDPNATPTFPHNNFNLTMVALKDINIGDEICVSYLDECSLSRSRHSRIKMLRENYIFTCRCPKCEAEIDEPDVTSEEEMSDEED